MKKILLFLITFYLVSSIKGQINTKTNISFENKIPVWMAENKVPCIGVGIIEDGVLKYVKVFGELKKDVPAPKNTIFNIASMTKPIVAIVTLKLVESGQWNLDESLGKYWIDPDVLNDTLHKKLTTRYILNHQSGFPNWRTDNKLKFEFEPGTKFQYSGEGYEYLRKAIEHKFNKSLAALSDSVLFKPLGMNDSYFVWNDNIKNTRFAFGHDGQGDIYEGQDWGTVNAAASMLMSTEDFGKFLVYVMNGAGLSPKLYNDMISPQVNVREHVARGLGWGLVFDLPNGEYAIEHDGGNPGIKTIGFILPKSKRGIVVLTNGDNGIFVYNNIISESLDLGKAFLDISNNAYDATAINLSNEILDKYVGTYSRSDVSGYNVIIKREGNELIISGDGVPFMTLVPESENRFFIKGFGYQYEFLEDEMNNVTKMNIYEKGKLLLDAKKIK